MNIVYIIGLILYVIISCGYFLYLLGDKFRKDKWYDYVLLAPVWIISFIVVIIVNIKNK